MLALKYRTLPSTLHVERTNPHIDLENSPFFVNSTCSPWLAAGSAPRRAGVSSFGIGGTNAHLILEEAPPVETATISPRRQLLVLSAHTASALDAVAANLLEHLRQHGDINLADAAYTLQVGRRALSHRRVLVCRDVAEASRVLAGKDPTRLLTSSGAPRERSVVWMFPGQGAQRANMLRQVYRDEPLFRASIDRCAALLTRHLGVDLRRVMHVDPKDAVAAGQIEQTAFAQPALFATEYALAQLWTSWGVHPQAMIGHSIGEYVAACLAGVFSLEDALGLVAARGRLIRIFPWARCSLFRCRNVSGSWELTWLAASTHPRCAPRPERSAASRRSKRLAGRGVDSTAAHLAASFADVDPMTAHYLGVLRAATPPRLPFVSNVTGTWIATTKRPTPTTG